MKRLALLLPALLLAQSTVKLDTRKFWEAARRADEIAYAMKHPKPGAPKIDQKLANDLATAMGQMAAERHKFEAICGRDKIPGFDVKANKTGDMTCLSKFAAGSQSRKNK